MKFWELCGYISDKFVDPNLFIKDSKDYGRGIYCSGIIQEGSFLCEYRGELVSAAEARKREKQYRDTNCYIYFFISRGIRYAIDATEEPTETDRSNFGRLINHSRQKDLINVRPQVFVDNKDTPRLYFVADRIINPGEQLFFDYGERRTHVLRENPWLKKMKATKRKLTMHFIDNEAEVSGDDSGDNDHTETELKQEDIEFINDDNNDCQPEQPPPNPYMDRCLKHSTDGFLHSDCPDCTKHQDNLLSKVIVRKERELISVSEIQRKINEEIKAEARRTEDSLIYRDLKDKHREEKADIKKRRLAEFRCEHCDVQCYSEDFFQKHLQSAKHKQITSKPVSGDATTSNRYCNTCNMSISKTNWAKHCKSVKHTGVKNNKSAVRSSVYKCNYCNIEVGYVSKARHTKTKTHLRNVSQSLVQPAEDFSLVRQQEPNTGDDPAPSTSDNDPAGVEVSGDDVAESEQDVVAGEHKGGTHFLLEFGSCVKYKICRKILKPGTYKKEIKDRFFHSFAGIFKSICVSNEFGDDDFEPRGHSHMYCETVCPLTFEEFKHYWTNVLRLPKILDIQRPKDQKRAVRYVTKADEHCVVVGINVSQTSARYKAYRYALSHSTVKWTDDIPHSISSFDRHVFQQTVKEFNQRERFYKQVSELQVMELFPWQQVIHDMLMEKPDDRTVMWVYDKSGDTGKSKLANYLSHMYPFCLRTESVSSHDIAYALDDNLHRVVVFDLAREKCLHFKYSILEKLKDGHLFSPKYESKSKSFDPMHVLVLCNYLPDKKMLTLDRWKVFCLEKVLNTAAITMRRIHCFNQLQDCTTVGCCCSDSKLTVKTPEKE